jgi:hypothetical protein
MKKLPIVALGVLCLFALFASPVVLYAQDSEPPVLLSVAADCEDTTKVIAIFDEPLEPMFAEDTYYYGITDQDGNGVCCIVRAQLGGDQRTVTLTLNQPLNPSISYTLSEIGVCDLALNCSWGQWQPIAFDTTGPVLVSAVGCCDGNHVTASFNEPIDPSFGADPFNYVIFDEQGNSVAIIQVHLAADQRTITIMVEPPLDRTRSYTLTAFMADVCGNFAESSLPISFDTTPPQVSCSVAVSTLFPANNMLVDVGLSASSSDGEIDVKVFSDEPEVPFLQDATYNDGVLQLRARRNPGSDGRVYLIVVTSTDECGNVGVCCTTVVVPESGGAESLASVQAQAAATQAQCSPAGSRWSPHQILP